MDTREAFLSVQLAHQLLKLPKVVTLETLRSHLVALRNREIVIEELAGLTGNDVCGMWLAKADRDLILHSPTRAPLHRQQIVLHEFGHMILKHDVDGIPVKPRGALIPNIALTSVHHFFTCGSFSDEAELAAEMLADLLAARIMSSAPNLAPEHLSFGEVFG